MSRDDNMIWKALVIIQKVIMVFTGIVTTLIVSLAMILRYVFDIDLVGYEEILVMVAFWLYMIGSAYGSYEKSQITADIVNMFLKEGKVKSIVSLIKSGLTLGLGLLFNYWAFQFVVWAIEMDTRTPVWRLPTVIGQGSIFVGLSFMTFYNAVYFYDEIKIIFQHKESMKGGISI